MSYIYLVVEDELHANLLSKILVEIRPDIQFDEPIGKRGNDYIKRNLRSYNQAARSIPFLVLTDLDLKSCPLALIEEWINFEKSPNLLFRIAVKEAEAWLLADRNNLAGFLSVSISKIPTNPESILDPKQNIINLARKSRKREIREDIAPIGTAQIGPAYNAQMAKFVAEFWNLETAQQNSESLSRLINRLRHFQPLTEPLHG